MLKVTLDARIVSISMSEIINQDTVRKVPGEGMPVFGDKNGAKGDLYITFKILFPDQLSESQRQQLKQILPS